MSLRVTDLWRSEAVLPRLPYLFTGVVLLAVKHLLDWLTASLVFDRPWHPFNYFVLPRQTVGVLMLPSEDRLFYGALLFVALPFIWIGILLTVQRLRDARLPVALVLLFFVPLVNIVLFLLLCVLHRPPDQVGTILEHVDESRPTVPPGNRPYWEAARNYHQTDSWQRLRDAHRRITRDTVEGSAVLALAVVVPATLVFVILSTLVLQSYAWGLFVGTPFGMGLSVVALFGMARPQGFWACILVCFLATSLVGAGMIVFALEGAICLLMAAPIGYFLAFLGGLVGFAIQVRLWSLEDNPLVLLVVAGTLPALMAAESAVAEEPDVVEICSWVEIDAPPDQVWKQVIAFPELPEPDDWVFHTGVAYPVRAEIHGHGPGAQRHCIFSTGAFVEPIDVWDEPHRLAFRVASQPEPMREWSPYTIHPPHLEGFLISRRGEFRLVVREDSGTRLEGSTWYSNRMWPACYWRLWSDAIIHRIHLRVLNHIKTLAETEPARKPSSMAQPTPSGIERAGDG